MSERMRRVNESVREVERTDLSEAPAAPTPAAT